MKNKLNLLEQKLKPDTRTIFQTLRPRIEKLQTTTTDNTYYTTIIMIIIVTVEGLLDLNL